MSIRNSAFASTDVQCWRDLYKATLLEKHQQKLPSRIAGAQRALICELENTCGVGPTVKKSNLLMTHLRAIGAP
jgi:hypothetical protein